MQEFLVLGLVPGTSFQITFGLWAVIALSVAGVAMLRAVHIIKQTKILLVWITLSRSLR